MANERLFEMLAEAYAQPSKTYRAFETGFRGIRDTAEEIEKYGDRKEKNRQRKLQQQSLSEVLGMHTPAGLENLSVEQANNVSTPVKAYADLIRAQREKKENARAQQANFLLKGQLMEYDPDQGYYPARVSGSPSSGIPDATGPVTPRPGAPNYGPGDISPRVAPTIPAEQTSKTGDIEKLRGDIDIVRQNYRPEFSGFGDNLMTGARQMTGRGATEEAAVFKSTVSGLRNKVLNLLSGAAISPDEAKRLLQQVPNEMRSDVDFLGKLDNFERELNDILSSKQKAFSSAGYRTPDNTPRSGPPTFNSIEEAERSGRKGLVIIGGRKAVIE